MVEVSRPTTTDSLRSGDLAQRKVARWWRSPDQLPRAGLRSGEGYGRETLPNTGRETLPNTGRETLPNTGRETLPNRIANR